MELNSIQEIIEDISQGKMVILMDDEDRDCLLYTSDANDDMQ